MVNILVTGAKGQLGESLRTVSGTFPGFIFTFTDLPELDLTDMEKTASFVREAVPSYLINCAAYTDVDRAEDDPQAAFLINRDVPRQLALLAEKYHFRLIHISTDYVFDGHSWLPYSEEDTPSPVSVYGKSKLAGEEALAGTEAVVVRTAWLYSEYGRNFVKTILNYARKKDSLEVVYDQVGSPTYAGDLALALLEIIKQTEDGKQSWQPGIFNYSGEGACSWFDIARDILSYTGIECHIEAVRTESFPRPAPRPAYSILAKEKIKSAYHIHIPYWRDSLFVCLENLKKQ